MTVTIVGTQFGDEGKGGMVDVWSGTADVVVRYQGGDNAGHTVVHDDAAADGGTVSASATDSSIQTSTEYALSLVPSGAVRGKTGVLGNGCVVNPETLFAEIDALRERGLDPDVRVAERAHVILPYHRVLDGSEEEAKGELAAGTTGNGIGPAYEDKAARRGVRIGDLLDPAVLRERLEYVVPHKRALAEDVHGVEAGAAFDVEELYEQYRCYGERLAEDGMTVDAGAFLTDRLDAGEKLMLEGAQGTHLDVDHGTYPYVTSSNPTAGGAATGSGLGPSVVGEGEIVGIAKAYLSRVGTGPLPTELGFVEGQTPEGGGDPDAGELADDIREAGGEYGTVTGRPRRIGWLDLPQLRHAARVNGLTGIALNHVDTLAGLDTVRAAHSYELDGAERSTVPAATERWAACEPQYREFEGWSEADWAAIAAEGYDALPANARTYVEYVSEAIDVPVYAVGVGPDRARTVIVEDPFEG
jgi:adenylosuccinate synthase